MSLQRMVRRTAGGSLLAILSILTTLLWPGLPAHAAGVWNLARGVSHFGRGGANIARPHDPVALHTNPSALAGLRGLQLMIDGNMIYDWRRFTRQSDDLDADGRIQTYDQVRNSGSDMMPSPGLFGAYNLAALGLEALTVGIGAFGPPRSSSEYPATGPQRYSLLQSDHRQIHYGLALAYQLPWFGLRLGATALLTSQIIDESRALSVGSVLGRPEDPELDIAVHLKAQQHAIPHAVLAFSATPVPWLSVAVSYQLPYDVEANGVGEFSLGSQAAAMLDLTGDKVQISSKMPDILRAAVRLQERQGRYDVELAYVHEGWSRYERIVVRGKDIEFKSLLDQAYTPLPDFVLEKRWRNTHSVRLGGSVQAVKQWVRVRAGLYVETSAVPERWLHVGSFDGDKLGGALGLRLDLPWGSWADLALGYTHRLARTVTNSQVQLLDPQALRSGADTWPTANGTYGGGQALVMLGVGVRIDV